MKLSSSISFLILSLLILSLQGCSTSQKSTDLKEYGYKGTVKSIVSSTYTDLEKKNGEWIIDESKLTSVSTVTFNKAGNMLKSVTNFPNSDRPQDVLTYSYEDDVKTGILRVDTNGDTISSGVYNWIDGFNYELAIDLGDGARLLLVSKLNENYRDESGSTTYLKKDTLMYSESYKNVIDDRNLLTRTDYFDKKTKEKSSQMVKYFDLDENGNPHKIVITHGDTGKLKLITTRKFTYFN